jgi:hypothetical protein
LIGIKFSILRNKAALQTSERIAIFPPKKALQGSFEPFSWFLSSANYFSRLSRWLASEWRIFGLLRVICTLFMFSGVRYSIVLQYAAGQSLTFPFTTTAAGRID